MSLYSPDYTSRRRNRFGSLQAALQAIAQRRQAANNQYASGSSALEIEKPNVLRGVLNNFASRGMAQSSGYGTAVQSTNTDFASRLATLAANRNAELASADSDESAANSDYQYDLGDISDQEAYYNATQQPEQVGGLAGVAQAKVNAASGGSGGVSRAEFLRNNPNFAQMNHAQRQVWLKNHPKAAAIWRSL